MNANINYDEIPDTSAVQEDLLAALSSQHVTVHTNEEPDFDYMENGDVVNGECFKFIFCKIMKKICAVCSG